MSFIRPGRAPIATAAVVEVFSVPDIFFVNGVASNHNLRQYVPSEFAGLALFIDGVLPAGVTFDDTLDSEQLVYDGTAGTSTVSGLILVVIPE